MSNQLEGIEIILVLMKGEITMTKNREIKNSKKENMAKAVEALGKFYFVLFVLMNESRKHNLTQKKEV